MSPAERTRDRTRVRIPADVERPDKLLAGLTARQLAILSITAVALWAAFTATRHVVPVPAFGAAAVPVAAVAAMVALGRFEGVAADRWVTAAWRHHRSPHRLVPAPDGIAPAPTFVSDAVSAGTSGRCQRRCAFRSPASGPTGSSTWAAMGSRWFAGPARSPSPCGPRPNKKRSLPGSPGS